MNRPARPTVLRGVHHVDGLLFERDRIGRVAAAWVPGSSAHHLDDGTVLLRFPTPQRVRCELAPGLPLIDVGHLAGAPGGSTAHPTADVVRFVGGEAVGADAVAPVAASELLDLPGWRVVHVDRPDTGEAGSSSDGSSASPGGGRRSPSAPEPVLVVERRGFDPRSGLGVAESTPDDVRAWKKLFGGEAGRGVTGAPSPSPSARTGRPDGTPAGAAEPRPNPLTAFLQRAFGIDERIRRRHERYLSELSQMFAAGRIDEALRRAVPIGGPGADRPASWWRPTAREDLTIKAVRTPATSSMRPSPGLEAQLKQRYRHAFEQLERQGRVLEAAYVLAELLDATEEACSFLERHGELQLAAELAEARSDDPSLAVRLWWRAGDRARAANIARRHGCYADAVARFEKAGDTDEALALRAEWGAMLLAGGDLVGALDACEPLPDGPALRAWRRRVVDLGVDGGGPLRARLLARQLRMGEAGPHPAVAAVLADPDAGPERAVLAAELVRSKAPLDHPAPARTLVRRLLGDPSASRRAVLDLVELSGDPVLRADLPTGSRSRPDPAPSGPLTIVRDASDRGHTGVTDVRALPDGRIAVALGALGLRVLRPDGRTAFAVDTPAFRLVPSDNGARLLAIRPLERDVVAVTVVDTLDRSTRDLGEMPASLWADSYDGSSWFVARGDQLWMLDLLADGPTALWQAADMGGPVVALSRTTTSLSAAAFRGWADEDGAMVVHRAMIHLPRLRLFREDRLVLGRGDCLSHDGAPVTGAITADANRQVALRWTDAGPQMVVSHGRPRAPIVDVTLEGASSPVVHLDGDALVVGDELGRIDVVDLPSRTERSTRHRLSARLRI